MEKAILLSDIKKVKLNTHKEALWIEYREKRLFRSAGWYKNSFTYSVKLTEEEVKADYRIEGKVAYEKPTISIFTSIGEDLIFFETIEEAKKVYDKLILDNNLFDLKKLKMA